MGEGRTGDRLFDYPRMMREALRQVPREALRRAAESGLPEPHHFYLSFRTDHPGVEVASFLRDRYPEEMTVILQHQFWDLEVDDEAFSVGLSFGGRPEHIRVPFGALTAFLDPGAEFGLRFDGVPAPPSGDAPTSKVDGASAAEDGSKPGEAAVRTPAEVVSIDKFRKK
jgi:hypothetical protein